MKSHWGRISAVLTAIIVILVAYFARLGFSADAVPKEFRDAREQSSVIAQDIVNLSNGVAEEIQKVNELDRQKKYAEALDATTVLIQRIPQMKKRGADLSEQLEKMTSGLVKIKSQDARQAAIESITNRMALISRLFSYSDYLVQLSGILQDHFREIPNNQSVPATISQINAEVTAINNFNRAASEAMDRFDGYISKSE